MVFESDVPTGRDTPRALAPALVRWSPRSVLPAFAGANVVEPFGPKGIIGTETRARLRKKRRPTEAGRRMPWGGREVARGASFPERKGRPQVGLLPGVVFRFPTHVPPVV